MNGQYYKVAMGASMIHDRIEQQDLRDRKLQSLEARITRESRVGWPTLTATAVLVVVAVLISVYLTLDACALR
ncbi:hypothetical protein BB934_19460 [Microvirga ossetica]|uniref:Uncharacterized protein n=2 Tax=Microvirga ossetica TaxID=1882682 RepID=A0A1B2EJG8_9HYPH|nr:hypothetical protein BB934_19460 [Microvirga ossetica]